jgi:hypothetical protein
MEWMSVEDGIPDIFAGKFKIRKANGNELDAFFCSDKMAWIAFYGQKTCFWWNAKYSYEPIHDVTHWRASESYRLERE